MFLCANYFIMEEKRKTFKGRRAEEQKSRKKNNTLKPYSRKETLVAEEQKSRKKNNTLSPYSRKAPLVGERVERKPRTFDKESRFDDRPPRKTYRQSTPDDRPPRKTYRQSTPDDRPPRKTYRQSTPDDRPPRKTYRQSTPDDRPPRTTYKTPLPDDRPPRKRRSAADDSEILNEIFDRRRKEGRSTPKKQKVLSLEFEEKHGPVRLNKYISNSGICSRRDADMLIQTGAIQVNGKIVTELGTKVMPTDEVRYGDKILQREKPVYLLLNKPKDYITTMEDERDRKHVIQLIKGACKERVYPVGRLDKNTTGLLLFTNDGEMTKKLTHPKHGIRKIYYVELNKNLTAADFEKIANGIELSDGEIKVDEIAYAGDTKREIGITLHSGRNRIVRRIFEQLGYEILKLDRVVFAGLTKKDLPRGKYRFLSEAEINILKMI